MTRANGTFRTVVLFCVVSVLGVVASARGALRSDADSPGGTVQLPLSDFTSAQGSTSVFFPPDPDLTAWSGRPPDYPRLGWMDYAGAADRYLVSIGRPSLGTTVTGTFTRRDVGGGKVEYSVRALVKNALAWCVSLAPDFTLTPLFGAHAFDVAAGAASPQHGETRGARRIWRVHGIEQPGLVQPPHPLPSRDVVDRPQAEDCGARPGLLERAAQAEDPFPIADGADA